MRFFLILWLVVFYGLCQTQDGKEHFIDVKEAIPNAVVDVRYFSTDNFVGARVDGYRKPKIYLTKEAAEALKKVQADISNDGLGLKIFDGYRPQTAVNHFVRWAKDPADTLTKPKYYPNVQKADVFKLGYVASRSGHSRGSTVDLTIIKLETGKGLDMGSDWDFFSEISRHSAPNISPEQKANRLKLKTTMAKYGFKSYSKEWWHYTLMDEPFPNRYFDFDID